MKKSLMIVAFLATGFATASYAYDEALAAKFDALASKMTQATLANGGCKMSPEDLLKARANKEKITLLDIRTPAEAKLVSVPEALHIPMDKLFKPENLAKLPTDGKLVVICHSGNRAAAMTSLLQASGFGNAVFLNGGLIALTTATTPKNVPLE